MAAILAGASAKVHEAGGTLAGGHTIRDDEPKYGLAVVGTVHPLGIWPKSGADAVGRARVFFSTGSRPVWYAVAMKRDGVGAVIVVQSSALFANYRRIADLAEGGSGFLAQVGLLVLEPRGNGGGGGGHRDGGRVTRDAATKAHQVS